ncbi:MAG: YlxR family protein [Actinomycetota bacterium]|nr:YlxR family protein [Actinomycetota bacterium]MDA8281586.1 YlxR family protein [Actinomycetota bacterium]
MGCRRVASIEELARVVLVGGELVPGEGCPGRGAWLCRGGRSCLDLAERRRAFDRALRGVPTAGATARLAVKLGWRGAAGQGGAAVCEDGVPGRLHGPARDGAKGS